MAAALLAIDPQFDPTILAMMEFVQDPNNLLDENVVHTGEVLLGLLADVPEGSQYRGLMKMLTLQILKDAPAVFEEKIAELEAETLVEHQVFERIGDVVRDAVEREGPVLSQITGDRELSCDEKARRMTDVAMADPAMMHRLSRGLSFSTCTVISWCRC